MKVIHCIAPKPKSRRLGYSFVRTSEVDHLFLTFPLRKCAENDVLITCTVFRLPNRNKTSWMHPRSKHCHLIVRRTDKQDVRVTKTTCICGADCWTDHKLVVKQPKNPACIGTLRQEKMYKQAKIRKRHNQKKIPTPKTHS